MKPSLEIRYNLLRAGLDNNDPLSIMNAFYTYDTKVPDGFTEVQSEYWGTMIAVLCERCAAAEKELKELKSQSKKEVRKLKKQLKEALTLKETRD